jgi:hypothetical protein
MGGIVVIKDGNFLTGLTGFTGGEGFSDLRFGCSELVDFRSGRLKSALHRRQLSGVQSLNAERELVSVTRVPYPAPEESMDVQA